MKKLFLLPLLVFLISCQPSKITSSWVARDITAKKYNKILVLGVLTDNDYELQSKIENHMADDLKSLGYNSIAANKVFPPGTIVKGDSAKAKTAIEGKGFDGILTIVMLNKEKKQVYVPGSTQDNEYYNRYGRFDRYMTEVSDRIIMPGYYAEQTKYIWENNFYDLGSRRLIYSARTSTFDIASKTTLAHTYGQLMVQSLINKKVILKNNINEE